MFLFFYQQNFKRVFLSYLLDYENVKSFWFYFVFSFFLLNIKYQKDFDYLFYLKYKVSQKEILLFMFIKYKNIKKFCFTIWIREIQRESYFSPLALSPPPPPTSLPTQPTPTTYILFHKP